MNLCRYPEENYPESLIDIEDLTENEFLVVCVENYLENRFIIYSWKGGCMKIDQLDEKEYINRIKRKFFSVENLEKVNRIDENPYNESDDFIRLL